MNKLIPTIILFFFISGTFTTTFTPVSASELVENSWNTRVSMNYPREDLGVVAVDGKIYAIGGYISKGLTREGPVIEVVGVNECYDPEIDTWVTLKPMPTSRSNFAIVAYQGKIYCMDSNYNEVYDPVTDSWSSKTPIPFKGVFLKAHIMDNKIFVIINSNLLYMYNPDTDTWTKKASVPDWSHYECMASFVIDDKLIIMGRFILEEIGMFAYNTADKLWVYDPNINEWSEETPSSFSQNSFALFNQFSGETTVTSGLYAPQRAYCFRNDYTYWYLSTVVYDPVSDTLSNGANASWRVNYGAVIVDDLLYVIGGCIMENGRQTSVSTNEQYVPFGYSTTITPRTFSNFHVVVAIALITGVATTIAFLFFYLRRRNRVQRSEYE